MKVQDTQNVRKNLKWSPIFLTDEMVLSILDPFLAHFYIIIVRMFNVFNKIFPFHQYVSYIVGSNI